MATFVFRADRLGGDALIMWVRDIDTGEYAERLSIIEASISPFLDVERRQ